MEVVLWALLAALGLLFCEVAYLHVTLQDAQRKLDLAKVQVRRDQDQINRQAEFIWELLQIITTSCPEQLEIIDGAVHLGRLAAGRHGAPAREET